MSTEHYPYDDIIFKTRGAAEEVLDILNGALKNTPFVTIANVFYLSGRATSSWSLNSWGWNDLRKGKVEKCKDGYKLSLPKPKMIVR